ncbi:MAG: hypothetical protein ACO2OX_04250 [Candidatus Nanopusillus sp.]
MKIRIYPFEISVENKIYETKIKYKSSLNKILCDKITENDLKLLFVNIDDLPLKDEEKKILKYKTIIHNDKEILYKDASQNLLQRLTNTLKGNLKLENISYDHFYTPKNIKFSAINEFIENPEFTLFITNYYSGFEHADKNKKWKMGNPLESNMIYERGDSFICFGNNSKLSLNEIEKLKYIYSDLPDFRFYVIPIYKKHFSNKKKKGIVIGLFITGLKGNYNENNFERIMEYVCSYIYSKYKILDNLMIYFYEYLFSNFEIDYDKTFSIFRKLFLNYSEKVIYMSFEQVYDLTGCCIYYQLPFKIKDKKMKKEIYLEYEIY